MASPVITVTNLEKYFRVPEKEPGLLGAFKSLINRQYRTVKAVDNISFSINEGELVGFIGPNGAGKTTTLKVLSGLISPTAGQVQVLGFNPWNRQSDFQKQFALVMGQKNQLWWDLPAMDSFLLNKEIYQVPDAQFQTTLNRLIKLLDVADILNVPVRRLSLGQRMKCELIASLLHSPKMLFLDEPTIGLDVVMQKTIRDFIHQYNQKFAATIILTSHYMKDVEKLARRLIIIDQGKIVFDGQLSQIIDRFARSKIISVVFSHAIDRQRLASLAQIRKFAFPQARLIVPRHQAARLITQILAQFPVADLTIEEPPIEAIIRDLFKQKNYQSRKKST